MKKISIILLVVFLGFLAACKTTKTVSKESKSTVFTTTNAQVKAQINGLLVIYYEIKDALVASDLKTATTKSKEFYKAMDKVDTQKMTVEERMFYTDIISKVSYDAEHMQSAPNLDHVREHFGPFSANLFKVVKAYQANNQEPVYNDYCPMQKTTWMSKEEAIKNPYYGKEMLNCGSVKETVK